MRRLKQEEGNLNPNQNVEANRLVELTTEIVSGYVAKNSVPLSELPSVIAQVHHALQRLTAASAHEVVAEKQPAVPVKKSVTPDYLVCLEDGKKFKSLKRHLMTHYGLSPADYRAKWGLPADYPMVAPNYAAARSALAKSMGLGRKPVPAKHSGPARNQSVKARRK